jgi:uncharacterized protein
MLGAVGYAVRFTDQPAEVLDAARSFLGTRPVEHNLILTLLGARRARPEPGRYWIVEHDHAVVGVVFQSPPEFTATITPMSPGAVTAVVDAILEQGVRLPAVNGEAGTAAHFAGCWAERARCPVRPDRGQRIYQLETLTLPSPLDGELRRAGPDDRELLVTWMRRFEADTERGGTPPEEHVDARLAAHELWLWDTDRPVSMAAHRGPVAGIGRIGPVYTPPAERRHGYAAACVGTLSQLLTGRGCRCVLYADLANPVSNAVYQRLGYRAAVETLRYRFDAPG